MGTGTGTRAGTGTGMGTGAGIHTRTGTGIGTGTVSGWALGWALGLYQDGHWDRDQRWGQDRHLATFAPLSGAGPLHPIPPRPVLAGQRGPAEPPLPLP